MSPIKPPKVPPLSNDYEYEIKVGNAVRCEACGCVAKNLQWTHFANKCSVKSIGEYKSLYPLAPLMAPNNKKRLGVTEISLKEKYGAEIGQQKWDQYKTKQALSNSFIIQELANWIKQ